LAFGFRQWLAFGNGRLSAVFGVLAFEVRWKFLVQPWARFSGKRSFDCAWLRRAPVTMTDLLMQTPNPGLRKHLVPKTKDLGPEDQTPKTKDRDPRPKIEYAKTQDLPPKT